MGQKLIARQVVDFVGGKGMGFASVNTGLTEGVKSAPKGVELTQRINLPVIEMKIPFTLDKTIVEAIHRQADAFDTTAIDEAAARLSDVENRLVFEGLKSTAITGIIDATPLKPIKVGKGGLVSAVADGVTTLASENVEGPYALLVGKQHYTEIFSASEGYPTSLKLESLLQSGGSIMMAPFLEDKAVVISLRGGDYELLSGVDIGIGYEKESAKGYDLFFFETCTFRIRTPEAAVTLTWAP